MLIGNRLDICFISLCVSNPPESDVVVSKWYQTWNRCSVALFQCCFVMDGNCYGEKVKKKGSVLLFSFTWSCAQTTAEKFPPLSPRERMCKNTKGLIVFLYLVAGPWQTPDSSIWSLTKIKWWLILYRMYTRRKPDPKPSHNSIHQSALTNHHVMCAGDTVWAAATVLSQWRQHL